MASDAKKRLTNIRPREVSFVDTPANEKDFLVIKNKHGGKGTEVLKKLEVAIHSINFWKYEYPDIQSVKDFLISQGVDPEIGEYKESDYEFRYVVNDAALFEGTSLAASMYVPMNKGVDSLIAVVKNLNGMIEVGKKGAKISSKNMDKIKSAFTTLKSLLDEVEESEVENVTKTEEVQKTEEQSTEQKPTEVKPEEKVTETTPAEEKPAEVKPAAEEKPAEEKDTDIAKRLEAIEKKFDDKMKEKDAEISVLKSKVSDMEKTPAEAKGGSVDATIDVKKNDSFWRGVV